MARLVYSEHAFADLERLTDFLIDSDSSTAADTVDLIAEAISILKRHPVIGRPVDNAIRLRFNQWLPNTRRTTST